MSNIPAVFETLKKYKTVKSIATQRTAISMSPARGDLNPKNITDHKTLRINWTAKMLRAILTLWSLRPLFHTRNAAIPINTNRVIQTGENTQLGGVNDGFSKFAYQVPTEVLVKMDPTKPAIWQMAIESASLTRSLSMIPCIK